MSAGIDPRTDLIPVAPAEHYHMGGIATDENARTSLPGLWAIGECASTGAHGANRLASNSLLEAIVFGARAAADVAHIVGADNAILTLPAHPAGAAPAALALATLRKTMTMNVGLERNEADLNAALGTIAQLERANVADVDMRNMTATALLIAGAALARKESRGGHFRSDYPRTDQALAQRTFTTLGEVRASMDGKAAPARLEAVK
jgi:L-aspartate oxidase